jgi:hypothetical protein
MNFDPNAWDWPQWAYLGLLFLALVLVAGSHGKPREPHNAFYSFLNAALVLFLLTAGGFFA